MVQYNLIIYYFLFYNFYLIKGTVSVISIQVTLQISYKDSNAQFTMLPLKAFF